jgi:hypothetical protein
MTHLGDLNGGELAAAGEVGELWWQIGQASQARLWADPLVFLITTTNAGHFIQVMCYFTLTLLYQPVITECYGMLGFSGTFVASHE